MFRIGEEVICVDDSPSFWTGEKILFKGASYIIAGFDGLGPDDEGNVGLILAGVRVPDTKYRVGWRATRFRKVQRRDINQWLETATDYEEPKRKKANA